MFERIAKFRKSWAVAVEGVEPPSADRIEYWCRTYSDTEIEHAFMRVLKKIQKGAVISSTSEVERYMSGVLRNEHQKVA